MPTTSSVPTETDKLQGHKESESTKAQEKHEMAEEKYAITLVRYITVRKKGASKRKTDIYIITPCGKRLRNNSELK